MSEKKYCDCIATAEEKILEFYKNEGNLNNPHKAEFKNKAFALGNTGPGIQPYLEAEVHSETKSGRPKKTKVSLYFTYCPFCGQNWKEMSAE